MSGIQKILIANRGEIARRIIRTCRRMGIRSVAVYSEADQHALHVREADEAYNIGPSQVKKSYLNIDKILEIALHCQADAIHPGYGFLSENAVFARKCEEHGLTFIGPDADIIEQMGSKIVSRQSMQQAGVPVVPGWDGRLNSAEEAVDAANRLGFPLMLKASAGGGGMGLRLVRDEEELKRLFASAQQQASSSFGDGSLFLERYVQDARHIEVQLAADRYGHVIHLFERECTIQRRNQKVLEESPSPVLSNALRNQLCETAVRGAKEIGYTNIGTMEFIFDEQSEQFYFLEMNTRIQVEHPVTEAITGLDLVELQIKLAQGEPLPLKQHDVRSTGYALEGRLYAEDPKTFFPSPGTIEQLQLPEEGVRLDFAVEEGSVVSPFYDPMIGKMIVHADNRQAAIEQFHHLLKHIKVEGIKTNLALLQGITADPDFQQGQYTTNYLKRKKLLALKTD
ncbi:acetyl-CoA carboxylase biotin carboxylase subunit [Desmospora activa]|uniref:biotin carboxylase n=1 Tax=Desmospora activa DSM 45169 TaxID=1121389 RepID=A0A2T4Z6K2_9BACL|nr:acetyl-CoA carboxylase biotin carboxylase subunit [Desmospora activa]PTM57528.1 acetyl-CoA carboxylase biotin carboxylase subunit [Desmospora activa DSM 45169]